MAKKSDLLKTPVEPFVVEPDLSADELLRRMERISFQGRNLASARRLWQRMLEDDVLIFLGVAGALSAGGLRLVIAHLIANRYVDCVVSTGANLYHDLHETRGDAISLVRTAPTMPSFKDITSTVSTTRLSMRTNLSRTMSGSPRLRGRCPVDAIPAESFSTSWAVICGVKHGRTAS